MTDKVQDMLGMDVISDTYDTNADIVFAVDASGSMQNMINNIKKRCLTFHEDLTRCLAENHRIIRNLRVKVIWFRDFYYDGNLAYGESRFFSLPEETEELHAFVDSIEAKGGGDAPESSLEALVMALRSSFVQDGDKKRHIIVLFTDEEAHPFEDYDLLKEQAAKYDCTPSQYPSRMPESLAEFYEAWESKDPSADSCFADDDGIIHVSRNDRRLIICAPDAYPWNDISIDLNNVERLDLEKGGSGEDLDMSAVNNLLAKSMAERLIS